MVVSVIKLHPESRLSVMQVNVVLSAKGNLLVNTGSLFSIFYNFLMSKSTLFEIFKKVCYHPYKVRLVHELTEDDFDRKLCETNDE